MYLEVTKGLLVPFIGTSLGAACVLFMKKSLNKNIQSILSGFAGGVMIAASVWSLLLPAIEQSENMGKLSFIPAAAGLWIGIFFLMLVDYLVPLLQKKSSSIRNSKKAFSSTAMLVFAVTLHNIPEGMAVGVVYAALISGETNITAMAAFTLALGIAIQNFPEGAIISMPLHGSGKSKGKAFASGVLSGIVEPIGALITIMASSLIVPVLPYLLSFAAGAMIYVVVKELIPEMLAGEHPDIGTISFTAGFTIMLALDVALG